MPILDLFWTMFLLFAFILWFWLLIVVFTDLFRRDMSGWGKAGWAIFLIFLPYLGVFVYVITQGRGMAERRTHDERRMRAAYEADVRAIATNGASGASAAAPAEQIATAKRLLDAGDITQEEYEHLKRLALGQSTPSTAP
jgi:Phospholipase_D-nuclease N-terminal/Short C-terminal domain